MSCCAPSALLPNCPSRVEGREEGKEEGMDG